MPNMVEKKQFFFFLGGGVLNLKMLKKNPGDWSWHCGWGRSKVELCLCFFFGWNEWISPSLTFKFQKLSRISRHTTSYLLEPKFFFGGWEGGLLATFGYGCHRIHGTIVYWPTWMVDFYGINAGKYTIHESCGILDAVQVFRDHASLEQISIYIYIL